MTIRIQAPKIAVRIATGITALLINVQHPAAVHADNLENSMGTEVLAEIVRRTEANQGRVAATDFSASRAVLALRVEAEPSADPENPGSKSGDRLGTGFLIAPGIVLTCHHIVGARSDLERLTVTADLSEKHGKPQILEPVVSGLFFADSGLDFAIFEVLDEECLSNPYAKDDDETTSARPFLRLAHFQRPSEQERIYLISCPGGQHLARNDVNKWLSNIARPPYLFHFASSYPGSSGGPILDSKHVVVGLHRGSFRSAPNDPTNLNAFANLAVLPSSIQDFLDGKKIAPEDLIPLETVENITPEFSIEIVLAGFIKLGHKGHEVIGKEALLRTKLDDSLVAPWSGLQDERREMEFQRILNELIAGLIDVDFPTWGGVPDLAGLYAAHYGDQAHLHAMMPSGVFAQVKAGEISKEHGDRKTYNLISIDLSHAVSRFIRLRDRSPLQAARELGRIMHTLQDSYSEGHTLRDNNPELDHSAMISVGNIREYYCYSDGDHNKEEHKSHDAIYDQNGSLTRRARKAIEVSELIVRAAYSSRDPIQTRNNMLAVVEACFANDSPPATARTKAEQFEQARELLAEATKSPILEQSYAMMAVPEQETGPSIEHLQVPEVTGVVRAFTSGSSESSDTQRVGTLGIIPDNPPPIKL